MFECVWGYSRLLRYFTEPIYGLFLAVSYETCRIKGFCGIITIPRIDWVIFPKGSCGMLDLYIFDVDTFSALATMLLLGLDFNAMTMIS